MACEFLACGFLGGLGFFTRDNRYDEQFLSNYVDLYVKDALKRVPGVGNVIIFGERKFAMRLWLDPAKLASRNISAGEVVSALREQNIQVAAGALGDAPAPAEQMYQISVRAMGRLSEVTQFEDIVVKAGKDASLVRVKDIGRVELRRRAGVGDAGRLEGKGAAGRRLEHARELRDAGRQRATRAALVVAHAPHRQAVGIEQR